MVKNMIERFFRNEREREKYAFAACIVNINFNIMLFILNLAKFNNVIGDKIKSPLMKLNSVDCITDIFYSYKDINGIHNLVIH